MALGSLLASFTAERVERALGRMKSTLASAVAGSASLVVVALWPEIVPVAIGFFVSGFFIIVWNVVTVSLRQRITPPHLLGRMNASYRLLAWGAMPVGALLAGLLGEWIGIRNTILVFGLLQLLVLLARLVVDDDAIDAAEREAVEAHARGHGGRHLTA